MKRVKIGNTWTDLYQVSDPDIESQKYNFYVWHVVTARVIREFETRQEAEAFAASL